MDVDGSDSGGTSARIEPTGTQAETLRQQVGATHNQQATIDSSKMLLMLLKQFVSVVTLDANIDTEVQPEFRVVVRNLCEKAPEAARFLAATILEYSDPNSCPQDGVEGPQPQLDKNTTQAMIRKSVSSKDLSYQPPKAGKAKAEKMNSPSNSCQPKDGSKFHTGALAQSCVLEGVQPPIQKGTNTQDRNVEMHGAKSLDDVDASAEDVSWLLDQQQFIAQDNSGRETGETADNRDAVDVVETEAASVCSEAGGWPPTTAKSATQTASLRQAPADIAPAAPIQHVEDASRSPQTEEIYRDKIPASLESDSSSPRSRTGSSSPKVTSFRDMILEAVRIIHQFSKYPHGVPREVHSRILQTLREHHGETTSVPDLNEWSDGSMWIRVLEAGGSENRKVTIFNMLEYIGAWEWYDGQIKLSQATVRTKKNKLVDRKGAAIHVLNKMQGLPTGTEQPGKWVSGVGRLDMKKEGDKSGMSPESWEASITEQVKHSQRRRISMQLSRGQKLSTKLVKELGIGILLSPKIWEYTKMDGEQLDSMIKDIQADSKIVRLFEILGQQLELLINKGQPNLHSLYISLKADTLVSEEELRELRATFALESEAMPERSLNIAVDQLIEDVSTKVLGKRKRMLKADDNVTVDGGVDIFCNTFNMLRQGKWLDNWMIMAGVQMSDKPSFVRYGYSVALDLFERFNRSGTRRVSRPLAGWRKKIEKFRSEGRIQQGQGLRLVYFCPLNSNNDHFTLLEINEREEKIYHYDSMASEGIIDGRVEISRVGKLVQEEFHYLKFQYVEAPTPQQKDTSSCGPMVVRNSALRMNGLCVGGWHDVLNPERLRMEIVKAFKACISDNAMQRREVG